MSLTREDHRNIAIGLASLGHVLWFGGVLWGYLALCIGRELDADEREDVCVRYLGWKPRHEREKGIPCER